MWAVGAFSVIISPLTSQDEILKELNSDQRLHNHNVKQNTVIISISTLHNPVWFLKEQPLATLAK